MSGFANIFFYRLTFLALFFLFACKKPQNPEITDVEFFVGNQPYSSDTVLYWQADLTEAVDRGIFIPSERQVQGGKFVVSFKIHSPSPDTFCYALIWHNNTYAWPDDDEYSDKVHENFYGCSNLDTTLIFKEVYVKNTLKVLDSFCIYGNPRNERKYFGKKLLYFNPDTGQINASIRKIRNNKEWYKQVKQKAKAEKRTVQYQLFLDALWDIDVNTDKEAIINRRERRNPRMGEYEMILVVLPKKYLSPFAQEVKNLGLKDDKGNFVNVFYFWRKNKNENIFVYNRFPKIKVSAAFNPKSGIFIDTTNYVKFYKNYFSSWCNAGQNKFKTAHFAQYIHYLNPNFPIHNIPVAMNTNDSSFTVDLYRKFLVQSKNQKSGIHASNTCYPCKTVGIDSLGRWIIYNPSSVADTLRKENVGIVGRIGFTYGRWTAKIKFNPILNKNNIWNGLTAAFWLMSYNSLEFNNRRPCECGRGYIPKYEPDVEESFKKSVRQLAYSEIDFEIVKESRYWPPTSYPDKKVHVKEKDKENEIMVCCTNWDMSCVDPPEFFCGAKEFDIDGVKFTAHRWNPWYKAITSKIPFNHKEMFGRDYFYFQIEWKPDRIIWRVGPEKNQLKTICIMTDRFTSIPDNQMVPVITQEWHHQDWWPTAPYKQNAIPCPNQDMKCIVYEVMVE